MSGWQWPIAGIVAHWVGYWGFRFFHWAIFGGFRDDYWRLP